MSIDPAPTPSWSERWKQWQPGDESPELPAFRACHLSDCESKGKEQAVSPDDEACGFCGYHWDSEELVCRHCGHIEIIGPGDDPPHCRKCGTEYPL